MSLYRVTTSNACFGIVVEGGIVVRAAPIATRAAGLSAPIVGQPWADVRGRYRGTAEEVETRKDEAQLEKEVAALLEAGDTDRAWIATGYLMSAMLRRKWYARVKAALSHKEVKSDDQS